jgi:N-acetylneuraminic acid mutarotase
LQVEDPSTVPGARSGHTAVLREKYMMIFGGIYEITKELNDAYLYDIEKNEWILFFSKKMAPSNTGFSPSPTKSQYSFSSSPL